MINKINFLLLITCGLLVFSNQASAASNNFVSNNKITVANVTFGATTTDLIIMSNSSAESWSYAGGSFTVTNPDSTNTFKVGSTNTAVTAIRVLNASSTVVACVKNSDAGNSYVSLPSDLGVYSVEPSSISLPNSLSYNATCGAATCGAGYVVSGSGSSAVCSVQSSGGGGGGGGSSSSLPATITAIGSASSPISLTVSNTQEGNLSQTLSNGFKVDIAMAPGSVSVQTTISATSNVISSNNLNSAQNNGITLVGGQVFEIKATDISNNVVSTFSKPIVITLTIPSLPTDTSKLGVYYYNETSKTWVLVPNAVFDSVNLKVIFSVNHLTEFGVFKVDELTVNTVTETTQTETATTTELVSLNYIKTVSDNERVLVKTIDQKLTNRLLGFILLQVETLGRAWYLNPVSLSRSYLADGLSAFNALREHGLGIKNSDLSKIPIGLESRFAMTDSDQDGLPDKLEEALKTDPNKADTDGDGFNDGLEVKNAYDPLSVNKIIYSKSLVERLKGRIVLQVEGRGEAWYINPMDSKRYYLANGEAAYQIMRYLSIGISDNDIQKIKVTDIK